MEIQKRDPRAFRHVLIVLAVSVAIAVAAVALIGRYRPAFEVWIDEDPLARLRTLALLASLGLLPFAAAGTYFFRLGARVVRAERFPPPGTTVVRDTAVLRGRAARRRGRLLQALAVILIVATAGGIAVLLRLAAELAER